MRQWKLRFNRRKQLVVVQHIAPSVFIQCVRDRRRHVFEDSKRALLKGAKMFKPGLMRNSAP